MNIVACNGSWVATADGTPVCNGTLVSVPSDQLIPSGMSLEDAQSLSEQAIVLFAVVFAVLAIRKAIK